MIIKCYKCHEEKDSSLFYATKSKARNFNSRDNKHSYCKECQKKLIIDAKREKRRSLRVTVMKSYGGKCASCGFDDIKALALDHVNDDGAAERKKWKGKMDFFYKKIVDDNFPDTYQVLCANCNAIKEWQRVNGEVK